MRMRVVMRIVRAGFEDLPEILKLQHLAYQSEAELCGNFDIPPLTQVLSEVEAEFEKGIFLKALEADGRLAGSVRAFSVNGVLHIGKLFVHPDLRGRGLGSRLLKTIEELCPHDIYELFTSSKSFGNIRLYERAGYAVHKEEASAGGLSLVYLRKRANR